MHNNPEMSPFQTYIYKSRYSRWIPEKKRREEWHETVRRYINFISDRVPESHKSVIQELEEAILHMEVMPSMRAMMTAGKALEKDEIACFNCTFVAVDDPRAFDEAMYVSMCSCGLGFSVERQYVNQLPTVAENFYPENQTIIKVRDSKIGWSTAFRQLIALLYGGLIPKWDISALRPAGSILKTFGGRASGPEPLDRLFKFTVQLFRNAAGRKLTSIECHDLMCMVLDVVVSGGVRRSAGISLSNLSDDRMRNAKTGQWWVENPQRALSNNSAVYTEKPDIGVFMKEWFSLYESKSGERGIFNRDAAIRDAKVNGRRKWKDIDFGVNPCVTGDTLVYVADGRGNVPIAQLAEEGKDVLVFCLDTQGAPAVRWMRHPRITGHQVPIVRVTLDDGSSIRVTPNDKLRVKSGEEVEAQFLVPGQSLDVLTRFEASIKDAFKQANAKYQDYLWVNHGQRQNQGEHRLICAFHVGTPLSRGVTHEELRNHALILTRQLRHRFSTLEWQVYAKHQNLPQSFSGWREAHLGGILGLAKWAAMELGFEHIDTDPRLLKTYTTLTYDGYDCDIVGGTVLIHKKCELCSTPFSVDYRRRESGVCGMSCASKRLNSGQAAYFQQHKQNMREKQLKVYTDAQFALGRTPLKTEWVAACKAANISMEISRSSSPFQSFTQLSAAAGSYNHRVVKVEDCGVEDVYDGTVDEFHNFFIGGFAGKCKNGKNKWTYVNHRQCGEIFLRSKGLCNLTEVICRSTDIRDTLMKKVRIATILGTIQSTFTNFRYLRKEWQKNAEEERLLGVSLTGIMDNKILSSNTSELGVLLDDLRQHAIDTNAEWSAKIGINPSVAITCVKPSGCRPWYALTTTEQGILTLEELLEDHPESSDWADIKHHYTSVETGDRIVRTFHNGTADVLRILMSYGLTVESTKNHEWGTKNRGWVRSDDIRLGDVLDIRLGVYANKTSSSLLRLDSLALRMCGDADDILQPDYMSGDLAWFLGYLWGDGAQSPGKYRIRFTDENRFNLEKVQRVLKSIFGLNTTIGDKYSECAYTLDCASKMLWHWLIKNGVWKYFADSIDIIPRCVRSSSKGDICAFVAGLLDSDGWVGNCTSGSGGGKFIITTASRFFAHHLQDICWAVGIGLGRSLNNCGKNLQDNKNMYLMTGASVMDEEAFSLLLGHSNKLTRLKTSDNFVGWHHVVASKGLIVGKVIGVDEAGKMPTFDGEVANSHWFWAGSVKSHNTVSQLVDSSSGIHPRYSRWYTRSIREDSKNPVGELLKSCGVTNEPDVTKPDDVSVFCFPIRSPEDSVMRDDLTAIQQLELYLTYKQHWTEHNVSCTVYVRENEWLEVAAWVYKHFDSICGVAFLPHTNHSYRQAPYTEIGEDEYLANLSKMPRIDWSRLSEFEKEDHTSAIREAACSSGHCEL